MAVLVYDPSTGIFYRAADSHNGRWKAGQISGALRPDGYLHISIGGINYFAHQLAWLIVYEELLINGIDHKNRVRSDNRIDNLRRATGSNNQGNRTKANNNKSGFRGVVWNSGIRRWQAQIGRSGSGRYIGTFDSKDQAAKAYDDEARKYFGEFAVLNFPEART